MRETILAHLEKHEQALALVKRDLVDAVEACAAEIVRTVRDGGKVLVMGNGGSAADAQHLAAELVCRYVGDRPALPAIALTTDSSILTAVSNDYGFADVFLRQVQALATPRDLVIGISTSGNSPNVNSALRVARQMGCGTVGLLGRDGGEAGALVDLALVVPAGDTPHIQEAHVTIIHILCDLVEKQLFPGG